MMREEEEEVRREQYCSPLCTRWWTLTTTMTMMIHNNNNNKRKRKRVMLTTSPPQLRQSQRDGHPDSDANPRLSGRRRWLSAGDGGARRGAGIDRKACARGRGAAS
eukprot:2659519-Rhodomonas_salina.1